MKNFLIRILLAAALTLAAFALVSSAQAQQADEDPAPATPRQQQPSETPKSSRQPQVPAASGDAQTNDAQTQQAFSFTGRIANEEGKLVLKDPVTKVSYQLNDQSKAKPYFGKQVKVVGKLEIKSHTIHIDTIEPI